MTSHCTSMLESLCPAKHSCHQFKVHSNVISSPTPFHLLVSCTQVQHVTTGCCKAALQLQRYLIPLAAEVWAYHEASKCWLCVLNLGTRAQPTILSDVGWNSLSYVILHSRNIPHHSHCFSKAAVQSQSPLRSTIRLCNCTWDGVFKSHLTQQCDHVIIGLELWLRGCLISSPYPERYLNAKCQLVWWIDS